MTAPQPEPGTSRASLFHAVRDWVFDLDNTLYPHHSNLFSQIDVKMTAYVSELLTLPREEARVLQKELYKEYGTTLNGLMMRHGVDTDDSRPTAPCRVAAPARRAT